jgi:hypothetical protein
MGQMIEIGLKDVLRRHLVEHGFLLAAGDAGLLQ